MQAPRRNHDPSQGPPAFLLAVALTYSGAAHPTLSSEGPGGTPRRGKGWGHAGLTVDVALPVKDEDTQAPREQGPRPPGQWRACFLLTRRVRTEARPGRCLAGREGLGAGGGLGEKGESQGGGRGLVSGCRGWLPSGKGAFRWPATSGKAVEGMRSGGTSAGPCSPSDELGSGIWPLPCLLSGNKPCDHTGRLSRTLRFKPFPVGDASLPSGREIGQQIHRWQWT